MAYSRFIETAIYPVIVFLQIIPKIAIAPLFIIWFGFGFTPKLLLVFLLSFFPIVVASIAGFKAVDPDIMDFARTTGAGGWRMFLKIRLPQALPQIFTGLKVGAALAATAAVVAEFVASDRGLGYLLLQYNGELDTPMVFAIIVLLSLIGLAVYYVVEIIERLAIPWHVSQQPADVTLDLNKNETGRTSMNFNSDHSRRWRCSPRPPRSAPRRRTPSRLRLNWYMGGLHVPFYYGKDKGYYKEEGIDLTINEGRGSANTVQVVAAGTDTFGLADSAVVIATAAKGAEIKSVMTVLNSTGFSVVSLAAAGIKTPKDLEGKKFAVSPGDPLGQLFRALAAHNKLDMSKITFVQVDPAAKVVAVLEKRSTRCWAAPTTSTS